MADVRRGALFAALPTAVLAMAIGTGPWPLGFGLGGAAPFAGWFVFNLCLIYHHKKPGLRFFLPGLRWVWHCGQTRT